MKRFFAALAAAGLLFLGARGVALSQPPASEASPADGAITVIGKTACPIKYYVQSPNRGDDPEAFKRQAILDKPTGFLDEGRPERELVKKMSGDSIKLLSLDAAIGQKVEEDQPLATYEIPLESVIQERMLLSRADLKNAESLLSEVNKALEVLRLKRTGYEKMLELKSASPADVEHTLNEIEVLQKQRDFLEQKVKEERDAYRDRLEKAETEYGRGLENGAFPAKGTIRSPLSGYVLWMNFDVKPGMVFTSRTPLFLIGVLDPIVVHCAVHEIQAQRIKTGDPAVLSFHVLPGKTFHAKVSKISFVALPAMMQQPSFYELEVVLPNPELVFKEGMRCDVTITPSG